MRTEYDGRKLKCRYCNEDMEIDDVDYNFQGNYDIYWNCRKCCASAIEQIRFGKRYKLNVYRGEKAYD